MRRALAAVVSLALVGGWCAAGRAPLRDPASCALPPRDCAGPDCAALVPFVPAIGAGYEDLVLDDERDPAVSTSYLRPDLRQVIVYATARVACVAAPWDGNGGRLALGDMSESSGAIPGSARGRPRHPAGTHVDGRDIDLAYYQRGTADNHLRPICAHTRGGAEQGHCIAAPTALDAPRTALLIGAPFESPHVRIVGVDGRAAAPIRAAIADLCDAGAIAPDACGRIRLGYETAETGRGWYYAHHAHLHVSWAP